MPIYLLNEFVAAGDTASCQAMVGRLLEAGADTTCGACEHSGQSPPTGTDIVGLDSTQATMSEDCGYRAF